MLVNDDVRVEVAVRVDIPTRLPGRVVPHVHLHSAAHAVSRGVKISIISTGRILSLSAHPVERDAAAAKIIVLKVSCLLRKPEQVSLVMVPVADVEQLRENALLISTARVCLRRRDGSIASVRVRVKRTVGVNKVSVLTERFARLVYSIGGAAVQAGLHRVAVCGDARVGYPTFIIELIRRFVAGAYYRR